MNCTLLLQGWGDENEDDNSLKQVCVVNSNNKAPCTSGVNNSHAARFLGNFQPIEEEEPNYFEELEPKITSNPKIVNKTQLRGYHNSKVSTGGLYSSGTVLAPDELQDWRDEETLESGWGDADSDTLDDNVDLAEQSIREKRKHDIQMKIQKHQERNKRKQIEKQQINVNSNTTAHKIEHQVQNRH